MINYLVNARRYIINVANYILGVAIAINNRNCNKAIAVTGYTYAIVISAIAISPYPKQQVMNAFVRLNLIWELLAQNT